MPKEKRKKGKSPAAAGTVVAEGPHWPLFILAALGVVLSGYLTFIAWQGNLAAFCAEGAGCDLVLNSRWSTLLGLPTSFWGLLTYGLLAAVAWNRDVANRWRWAWVISLFGLVYSLYLTGISFLELQAACPYCLISLGLLSAIFIMTALQRPTHLAKFSWGPWLAKTVGAAAVGVLVLHLHYAGYWGSAPGPEDPWIRGLAEHLTKSEANFYGASWCPACDQQKQLFGSSEKRIPYVECSPGGRRAPSAPICNEKNITNYPTWIINGERHTGVQPLATLAQLSNFQYQGGQKP